MRQCLGISRRTLTKLRHRTAAEHPKMRVDTLHAIARWIDAHPLPPEDDASNGHANEHG
jgi:hypothetical protein